MSDRFSAVLIGSDTLLAECGEILVAEGHEVRGVVTRAPRIAAWAKKRGVRVVEATGDFAPAVRALEPDWLFAITYLAMIPEAVLRAPKRGAINFHDGPLPRYAGLNAPAWALMNQETAYGITWHRMTAGADEGEILVQRAFEIAPAETSVTLNTKNFAAALESFQELVRGLAKGTLEPRPQDLSQRTYFGKHARPKDACLLDFTEPAPKLEALVRALDFGRYPNPLGAAKIQRGDRTLIVKRAEARPPAEVYRDPGTVTQATTTEIEVATADGALALQAFSTLDGQDLDPTQAAAALDVQAGAALDRADLGVRERLDARAEALSRAEAYWLPRLAAVEAFELPYAVPGRAPEPADATRTYSFPINGGTTLAALAAYLLRAADKDRLHLFLDDAEIRRGAEGLEGLLATALPFETPFTRADTAREAEAKTAAALEAARRRGPHLRDLIARYPDLHTGHTPELAPGHLPRVGLATAPDPARYASRPGTLLTLVLGEDRKTAALVYDPLSVPEAAVERMASQIRALSRALAAAPEQPIATADLLGESERKQLIEGWNATDKPWPADRTIHQLIEARADAHPESRAVTFEGATLTYRELDARANQLAARLRKEGVGPDTLVGLYVERSLDLVVAILGIHKAGGAYVPLDPAYPKDRIAFMVEDSEVKVIVTQGPLVPSLPPHQATIVTLAETASEPAARQPSDARPENLAYVIYTSGSTGKPKGVQVEHRNVVSFFTGMDGRIQHDPPGVWLAVTSLSFDISVLELLWTLSRGFEVVVYRERTKDVAAASRKPVAMSLFYFSADEAAEGADKYGLLLEGARFADAHGFTAVWTPERHFHAFGGLYPNPAITGAAVAAITKHVQIRAGSVVLPLHHPVRVAESWSMVDNLSNGRVGVSFASGWQPNDFIFVPENYPKAKDVMFKNIETVKKLWRGETVSFDGPGGKQVPVRVLPRPIQPELPIWITTAGNPETYQMAGAIGANLLTHLLGQSLSQLAPKIALYRKARADNGFDPDQGIVSLMLHTFIGPDEQRVKEQVRVPLRNYLGTSLSLLKEYAWAFPAFSRPKDVSGDKGDDLKHLTPEEHDALLEHAFERYYQTSGLFGTPEQALEMIDAASRIGVDEIACLIDFGVPKDLVLGALPHLEVVRRQAMAAPESPDLPQKDLSLPAQLAANRVTHFQCTPSMARMLAGDPAAREALSHLRQWMIGGEAFPVPLAREIRKIYDGPITNMYGPTETAIWSSTHDVDTRAGAIPIGKPIANTQLYVLDSNKEPVPAGVPGELYIAGAGVVRGYLKRPELTAERFLPNPFRPGERMYRTGDLVKWRDDGVVEFLGRVDHQVKIRGYRIELGEIETLLGKHPSVAECVIVLREDTPGDQRLVAYAVPKGPTLDHQGLKAHLREKLPEFMVPAHFVELPELPRTPNGKIDRKALPAPQAAARPHAHAPAAKPESEVETTIAAIWKDTLAREEVGIDDNFFDIGGHSLLVVRMHRQLREALGKPISLTDLYRFPTIRSFAAFLGAEGASKSLEDGAGRGEKRRQMMMQRRGGKSG